jgi:hypothetical protein
VPDIPRLPWYETPIWLFVQIAEIGLLMWLARTVAPVDLSRGVSITIGIGLVALVFAANLLALRWLRARHRAG